MTTAPPRERRTILIGLLILLLLWLGGSLGPRLLAWRSSLETRAEAALSQADGWSAMLAEGELIRHAAMTAAVRADSLHEFVLESRTVSGGALLLSEFVTAAAEGSEATLGQLRLRSPEPLSSGLIRVGVETTLGGSLDSILECVGAVTAGFPLVVLREISIVSADRQSGRFSATVAFEALVVASEGGS
jgi:hypothetical protein